MARAVEVGIVDIAEVAAGVTSCEIELSAKVLPAHRSGNTEICSRVQRSGSAGDVLQRVIIFRVIQEGRYAVELESLKRSTYKIQLVWRSLSPTAGSHHWRPNQHQYCKISTHGNPVEYPSPPQTVLVID